MLLTHRLERRLVLLWLDCRTAACAIPPRSLPSRLAAGIAFGIFLPTASRFSPALLLALCWCGACIAFRIAIGRRCVFLQRLSGLSRSRRAARRAANARGAQHAAGHALRSPSRRRTNIRCSPPSKGVLRCGRGARTKWRHPELDVDRIEFEGVPAIHRWGVIIGVGGDWPRLTGRVARGPARSQFRPRFGGRRDISIPACRIRSASSAGGARAWSDRSRATGWWKWSQRGEPAVRSAGSRRAGAFAGPSSASVAPWSERSAAVVTAILIGDRAGLDDEMQRQLQEAGTYHVIAISGGNIAILAGLCVILLRLLGRAAGHRPASIIAVLDRSTRLSWARRLVGRARDADGRDLFHRAVRRSAQPGRQRGRARRPRCCSASTRWRWWTPSFALTFGATLGLIVGMPRLKQPDALPGWIFAGRCAAGGLDLRGGGACCRSARSSSRG